MSVLQLRQALTQVQRFKWLNRVLKYLNLLFAGWWILSIEMTLKYNHLVGVYTDRITSAGQLIPLCIGGIGIIKVFVDCRTTRSKIRRTKEEPWQGACEQCLRRGLSCSLSFEGPVEFQEDREDTVGLRKALLAAWLPWLVPSLYGPLNP